MCQKVELENVAIGWECHVAGAKRKNVYGWEWEPGKHALQLQNVDFWNQKFRIPSKMRTIFVCPSSVESWIFYWSWVTNDVCPKTQDDDLHHRRPRSFVGPTIIVTLSSVEFATTDPIQVTITTSKKINRRSIPDSLWTFLNLLIWKMFDSRVLFSAALLASGASSFTPSLRSNAGQRSKTNLHMSAALIVQNKGGGHGELGKCLSVAAMSRMSIAAHKQLLE